MLQVDTHSIQALPVTPRASSDSVGHHGTQPGDSTAQPVVRQPVQPVATVAQPNSRPSAIQPVQSPQSRFDFYLDYDTVATMQLPADTTYGGDGVVDMDSLMLHYHWQEPIPCRSLFEGHQLQVTHGQQLRMNNAVPDWIFLLLVLVLSYAAVLIGRARVRLADFCASLFSSRSLEHMQRNHNLTDPMQIVPFALVYVVLLSVVLFYVGEYVFDHTVTALLFRSSLLSYGVVLVGCLVYYFLRMALVTLLGRVFQYPDTIRQYNFIGALFYSVGVLVLLPFLLLLIYSPSLCVVGFYGSVVVISLVFVMRLVRGIQLVLHETQGDGFYLFLYLCIVEIVPLLILGKVLMTY